MIRHRPVPMLRFPYKFPELRAARRLLLCASGLSAVLLLAACDAGKSASPKPAAPAHTEAVAHATELLTVELTPEAEQRLGLTLAEVVMDTSRQRRQYAGDVIAPARGGARYGRFPSATPTDLLAMSQAQIAADMQVQRAQTQRNAAWVIYERSLKLLADEAGSTLERDRAKEQADLADANLSAAQAQRELLGPAVDRLGDAPTLWLRVPVFSGDLPDLDAEAAALVGDLGAPVAAQQIEAQPVSAPPSANPLTATVDLYYVLPNAAARFRLGQKLGVALPVKARQNLTRLPWSAVIHDLHGGEWVYRRSAAQTYQRQRVQVVAVEGDYALLAQGPPVGTAVVSRGASELFGVEFGVSH